MSTGPQVIEPPGIGPSPASSPPDAVAHAPSGPTRPPRWGGRLSGIGLAVVVLAAAYVAVHLHRRGHTTGDDYALYLRQAQSLFEGNIAQVISDNRLLWRHSVAVTPQMYPWGFALMLSPFVRLFGLDYGRLKLVEVACLCIWLVLFHGIVRRRAGRLVALVLTALFATAPLYLLHTDQLLTEFPHMMVVAVVIWWLDRVLHKGRLTESSTSDLIILGLLMTAAYNVRRESVVLVAVVAAAQLVDVLGARARAVAGVPAPPWRRARNAIGALPWRRLATPFVAFIGGSIIAQLLLPSTLVPDNGNSKRFILTRLFNIDHPDSCPNPSGRTPAPRSCANYPYHLLQQLGLTERPVYGLIIIGLAAAGIVVACVKAPRLNVPLAVLLVTTMLVIGTHFRMVSRYYFQVTPLIAFFATMFLVAAAHEAVNITRRPRWRRAATALALVPVAWLSVVHVWELPSRMDAAQRYNDRGAIQSGPTNPRTEAAFEIVEEHTRPDDIIVFYRARSLTLYTERRALQLGTTAIPAMTQLADYFLQRLGSDYSQPVATEAELRALGYELVVDETDWRLWRIPR